MRIVKGSRWMLAAAPVALCFLTGCGDFWEAPNTSTTTGFSVTASPASVTVAPGATSSAVTVTVTPGSSFTGTVTLSCSVTSAPTGATSSEYPTCTFSSSSLTFSSTTAQTPTVTFNPPSNSPDGAYQFAINGISGSTAATPASVCVEVSSTASATCTATPTSSGNFYILNGGTSGSISGYSMSSSVLNTISNSSYSVTGANAVAIAPSGESFLYVASTSGGITLYSIGSNGALAAGVNFNSDTQARALAVDPTGKWLLDASGSGNLNAYPITSAGALDTTRQTQTQPLASTAIEQGQITISSSPEIVAVALGSIGTQVFNFSSQTLQPGITPLKPTGTAALSVATDPLSRFLYIGETGTTASSGGLRVFKISSTGGLTELNASNPSSSGGVAPNFILPLASGHYVYVANGNGAGSAGNVTGFAVSASGISSGTTVATGDQPQGLAEDSTAAWVFEVNSSSNPSFDAYTIGTGGQLASQFTSTSAAPSMAIVAAP